MMTLTMANTCLLLLLLKHNTTLAGDRLSWYKTRTAVSARPARLVLVEHTQTEIGLGAFERTHIGGGGCLLLLPLQLLLLNSQPLNSGRFTTLSIVIYKMTVSNRHPNRCWQRYFTTSR